ncbi:hypothetical protein K9M78_04940 [Candidatus Bipolaricaulota bacterium]|nr:hypothetical protein [Candidatus Bipolaricaulota bacterium]
MLVSLTTIQEVVTILSGDLKRILTISLAVGALILAFSVVGLGQDEVQTPSEQAKIGYENVGSVMSEITGAEEDKSVIVKGALANLFSELAGHLEEKGVPDHVVEKFRNRADSLAAIGEELTKNQIASEASNMIQSVGRKDPGGGVPVSVLEKAGLSREDVKELTEKGPNKEKATEVVRKMAQKTEKVQEQDKIRSQDQARNDNGKGEGKPEEAGSQGNADKRKGNGNDATEAAGEDETQEKGNQGNGSDKAGPPSVEEDETEQGNSAGQGSGKAGPPSDEVGQEEGKDRSAGNNGNPPENPGNKDRVGEETDDRGGNPGKGKVNPGNGKDKKEKGEGNGRRPGK